MGKDQIVISKSIIVHGRVQGVYFRASAKQKAQMLGLQGIVKNLDDGTVYMEVQGSEDSVKEMEQWCKHGPALAKVDRLDIEVREPFEQEGFDITH